MKLSSNFLGAAPLAFPSFAPLAWLGQINESHQVFSISIKQLGLDDFNYIQDAEEEILKANPIAKFSKVEIFREDNKTMYIDMIF